MLKTPLGVSFTKRPDQSSTGVYEDVNGVDAFEVEGLYLVADILQSPMPVFMVDGPTFFDDLGNAQKALGVNLAAPPQPPTPGPLDYIENGEGLDEIVVEYELARPVAMMGITFRHSGEITTITATHGGEPLELVDFVINPDTNIGAATFIGNNLTVEPANLVVTPDAGTIGPAVLRIDDSFAIDEVEVGSTGAEAGYGDRNNLSSLIKFEPVTGEGWGVWALAGDSGEKEPVVISRGAGQVQKLFWGVAASGTLQDVPDFVNAGSGWTQNGEWWEHTGVSSYLVGENLSEPMPNPFWLEVEIDVSEGSRIYIQTVGGGGYLSEMYLGPFSGVVRIYRSQSYSALRFQVQSIGDAKFRNFQYCNNGSAVMGAFGRTANKVPDGSGIQFQMGALSRYAGIAMEVHEG